MDKVIETFMLQAEKDRDFARILRFQWALNSADSSYSDLIQDMMLMKHKEKAI